MFKHEEYIQNGEIKVLQSTLRHLISRMEVIEEDHNHTKKMIAMILDNLNRRLSRVDP